MGRVDLGHGPSRLPPWRLVAAGAQVQVDPAALELELVDLALGVILAASLEGEDFQVAGQVLELGQQFSDSHLTQRSVTPLFVVLGSWPLGPSVRPGTAHCTHARCVLPPPSNRARRADPPIRGCGVGCGVGRG